MRLYVASSWRNPYQPGVVRDLRDRGHQVYDFRNPEAGDSGFHWSEIDPNYAYWGHGNYLLGLDHPVARAGFEKDAAAMAVADGCVLLLPCGRSAHLEAGWFVGQAKPLWILLDPHERLQPELMYRFARGIHWVRGELYAAIDASNGGPR